MVCCLTHIFLSLQSNGHISLGGGDHYQERLSRLESDKESLVLQVYIQPCFYDLKRPTKSQIFVILYIIFNKTVKSSEFLQVSVLTDQVEAQGEKIRDLDLCLDEHREKLNATEDMLQQVGVCHMKYYSGQTFCT